MQGSDQNVSRRGALASVATTEGLSSQRSYCKALIKMSEPCNRKILFVQFEKCMCIIPKPPFSASLNLTFCYRYSRLADIMLTIERLCTKHSANNVNTYLLYQLYRRFYHRKYLFFSSLIDSR